MNDDSVPSTTSSRPIQRDEVQNRWETPRLEPLDIAKNTTKIGGTETHSALSFGTS